MLSLAGISLSREDPALLERAWLHLDPPLWPAETPPGHSPALALHPPLSPRLGILRWPVGASRWAVGRFLAHHEPLQEILQAAADAQGGPLTLRLDDGTEAVEAPVFLLTPRPLYQQPPGGDPGRDYYLLDVADARWRWWSLTPGELADGTSWADAFGSLGTLLGVTVEYDAVDPAYGDPPVRLLRGLPAPAALDLLSLAAGQRVVLTPAGRLHSRSSTSALALQEANLALGRAAGGALRSPGPLVPESLRVLLPANYAFTVSLADLSLPSHAGLVPGPFTATLRHGLLYQNPPSMPALADALAADWYRWRAGWACLALNGYPAWEHDGLSDVEYEHAPEHLLTRIVPPPPEEIVFLPNCCPSSCCCDAEIATDTIATDTHDYAVPTVDGDPADAVRLDVTGPSELTGIVRTRTDQRLTIFNPGDSILTLKHEDPGSATTNRIHTSTQGDLAVPPGMPVHLFYDETISRWTVVGGPATAYDTTRAPAETVSFSPPAEFTPATWAPVIPLDPDTAVVTVPGLVPPDLNVPQTVTLINEGDFTFVLEHDSGDVTSSVYAFDLPNDVNLSVPPGGTVVLTFVPGAGWTTTGGTAPVVAEEIILPEKDAADVPTPPAGAVAYYTDGDGDLAYKDESDVVGKVGAAGGFTWTEGTLAAAGSIQGDAAAITARTTEVTGADGTKGVILPNSAGLWTVWNSNGSNNLKVYPPSGAQIASLGTNVNYIAGAGEAQSYLRVSSTKFLQITAIVT